MQVTCQFCGAEAVITPEFHVCQHCGGDLASLLSADLQADYFYQKACEAAERGETYIALQQVQRGLAQGQNRSDLHLLAAIFYSDLGREEQLRMHIGAIPIDDPLRPEAETLLKQMVAKRQRQIQGDAAAASDSTPSPDPAPALGSPILGPRLLASILTLAVLVTLLSLSRMQVAGSLAVPAWLDGLFSRDAEEPSPAAIEAQMTDALVDSHMSGEEERPNALDADESSSAPGEGENLADAGERWNQQIAQNVMQLIAREKIDFAPIVEARGYPDLAGSEVTAVVLDTELVLMGVVSSREARQAVLDVAYNLRGVSEVDAYGLRIVLPAREYEVQAGDSLWRIAQTLLGDGNLWPEIITQNPALESNELEVGMTLQIPSIEVFDEEG